MEIEPLIQILSEHPVALTCFVLRKPLGTLVAAFAAWLLAPRNVAARERIFATGCRTSNGSEENAKLAKEQIRRAENPARGEKIRI